MDEKTRLILRSKIYPLAKAEDNGLFEDFTFLPDVLKGIRVLALGESTHGTREHFQFKHRIFRFLAENYGYRTIMFEAPLDACDVVNDYVLYGEGTREKALAGLHFWTWDTEEVSAMVDWMREHNRSCSSEEKVYFLGFDCQSCDVACRRLRETLLPASGENRGRIEDLISRCEEAGFRNHDLDSKEAAWLLDWLGQNRRTLVDVMGGENHQKMIRYARHLFQFSDLFGNPELTQEIRDGWMAENVSNQLNQLSKEEKLIIWAHNAHICGKHPQYKNLGERLFEKYGDAYYALGFSFGEGSFQARLITPDPKSEYGVTIGGLREFLVPESSKDEWDHEFSTLCGGNYFLDLRTAVMDPAVHTWASQEKKHRIIGSGFREHPDPERYCIRGKLEGFFSGVLYTQKTSRARPTKTGMR